MTPQVRSNFSKVTTMKKLAYILLASLSFGVAAQASAQTSGLTRADVKQQLVRAEAQGLLPSSGTQYPPNARTIARNRAIYDARYDSDSTARTSYGGVSDQHTSE
jgi:hypothetical protein